MVIIVANPRMINRMRILASLLLTASIAIGIINGISIEFISSNLKSQAFEIRGKLSRTIKIDDAKNTGERGLLLVSE